MGCDIRLFVERKKKGDEPKHWYNVSFSNGFINRYYNMFAVMANVRNYESLPTLLPVRGVPHDAALLTLDEYYKEVIPDNEWEDSYESFAIKESLTKEWVNEGYSHYLNLSDEVRGNKIKYCSDPDALSPSWCTTKELGDCFKIVSQHDKFEDIEWKALINYMKTFEKGGFDCRAVFWFK